MEFRKREVKRPEMPDGVDNKQEREIKEKMTLENRVLVISVSCEMFEISELNGVDVGSPIQSIDRTFDMSNGIRHFIYPISTPKDVTDLTSYWKNDELVKSENKKIKFSLRKRIPTQKEEIVEDKEIEEEVPA